MAHSIMGQLLPEAVSYPLNQYALVQREWTNCTLLMFKLHTWTLFRKVTERNAILSDLLTTWLHRFGLQLQTFMTASGLPSILDVWNEVSIKGFSIFFYLLHLRSGVERLLSSGPMKQLSFLFGGLKSLFSFRARRIKYFM